MPADPKSKTLSMPDLGVADPDFYADNPTASRGTSRDNGNIGWDDLAPGKPLTHNPFKNLKGGR